MPSLASWQPRVSAPPGEQRSSRCCGQQQYLEITSAHIVKDIGLCADLELVHVPCSTFAGDNEIGERARAVQAAILSTFDTVVTLRRYVPFGALGLGLKLGFRTGFVFVLERHASSV